MKIKDSLILGLIMGIILPVLGVLGFYYSKFAAVDLAQFVQVATKHKVLSPMLSLCAVLNLATFFLFLNKNYYLVARGIILATIIYGVTIVILKFVM
ncbi:MAG: hypothetical protein MUE96_02870 [Bacteroidia bacterium]|jgi:hypothetical protein|nr:hypothetical protein [Bacteroidia bacterium]